MTPELRARLIRALIAELRTVAAARQEAAA